jgi:hypothetical protein
LAERLALFDVHWTPFDPETARFPFPGLGRATLLAPPTFARSRSSNCGILGYAMRATHRPTSPAAAVSVGLDPLIVEAAKEVDVTLLDWALSLTPRERLRAATNAERALRKFVHAPPEDRDEMVLPILLALRDRGRPG